MARSQNRSNPNPEFNFEELLQTLKNEHPNVRVLTGMLKTAIADNAIMFAHVGDCRHWAEIPGDAVANVIRLGHVGCDGHEHVWARVTLKQPSSDTEKAYANLVGLHSAKLADAQRTIATLVSRPGTLDPRCPPGSVWNCDQFGNCRCEPILFPGSTTQRQSL
jgi:hypothetical protein